MYSEEFSAEIDEIPVYEGQDEEDRGAVFNSEADLQEKITKLSAQIDLESQELLRPQAVNISPVYKAHPSSVNKPSLLKRMWNSLKTAESNDVQKSAEMQNSNIYEDRKENVMPTLSKNNSQIHDVPAFLRKK